MEELEEGFSTKQGPSHLETGTGKQFDTYRLDSQNNQ
jgi:hypothetical protein